MTKEKNKLDNECIYCNPEKYKNIDSGSTVPICEKHYQDKIKQNDKRNNN